VDRPRERIFNVPAIILAMGLLFGVIHALMWYFLDEEETNLVLLTFAFIPARYEFTVLAGEPWFTGWGAAVWSFVTYAFLHSDLNHLLFNLVWLLAFGAALARRFGAWRFVLFFAFTSIAGALAHLFTHVGEFGPMIGASAGITGAMGAVMRFMFQPGGGINVLAARRGELAQAPAMPLGAMLRNRRVLIVLVVSVGVFVLFGLRIFSLPGVTQTIAWEAHVGGFVAGLLALGLFDPVRAADDATDPESASSEASASEPVQDYEGR
jgi:membrane associated rhomboid family serine protease